MLHDGALSNVKSERPAAPQAHHAGTNDPAAGASSDAEESSSPLRSSPSSASATSSLSLASSTTMASSSTRAPRPSGKSILLLTVIFIHSDVQPWSGSNASVYICETDNHDVFMHVRDMNGHVIGMCSEKPGGSGDRVVCLGAALDNFFDAFGYPTAFINEVVHLWELDADLDNFTACMAEWIPRAEAHWMWYLMLGRDTPIVHRRRRYVISVAD